MTKVRTVLATALAFATALVAWWVTIPMAPSASAETTPGRVVIDSFAPLAPRADSVLRVTGRIGNAGTAYDLTDLSVRYTISAFPLPSRDAIAAVSAGSNAYDGYAISATRTPVTDVLRPGQQVEFALRAPVADIPLPVPGVYVLGVELIGVDPTIGFTVLAIGRVLLPWVPEAPDRPLKLGMLWPLAIAPARSPDGVLLNDELPQSISTDGTLAELLALGAAAPREVSWVVDPELVQTTRDMGDGYLVAIDDEIVTGTAQDAARQWTQRLARATERVDLWTLPYADVDADALQRGGLDRDVVRAITTAGAITQDALGSATAGTVYWAPGGEVDIATWPLLASAGVRTVILRDDALPPVVDPGLTPSGSVDVDTQFGPLRATLVDSGLRDALAMPQASNSERLMARQRFLSETAFIALEDPSIPRTVFAGPANPRWRIEPSLLRGILSGVRAADWVDTVSLGSTLATPPSDVTRQRTAYGPRERERELSPAYVERISDAQASLALLRQVVVDPLSITEPISSALLRSASSAWRTRPALGEELLDIIQADLDSDTAQVSVVSRGTITFSGDTGRIPITVANDFDRPVTVGLRVESQPSARLISEPLEPLEIDAGKRASLEVPVRIIGGDALAVTVHLITVEGADFGAAAQLQLQTTAYSRAALWVSIGAAALLVLLVIWDGVRRARARRRAEATAGTP